MSEEQISHDQRHVIFTSGYLAGQQELEQEVAAAVEAKRKLEQDLDQLIGRLKALALESQEKGKALQQVKELNLVGNAYVGMASRIGEAIGEEI